MVKTAAEVLDFTDVSDGGGQFNKRRLPEGDYVAKVTKVEEATSKSDNKMWVFTIQVKHNGVNAEYGHYCILEAKHLWKIRSLWAAAGVVIPKKRVKLDPNAIVGKTIGVTLEDTEYNDKLQSQVRATIPVADVQGNADDDDVEDDEEDYEDEEPEPTPAPKAKRRTAAPPVEEPEDEDEEDLDETEEEEEEEAPPPPPRRAPTKKAAPAKKTAARKTAPPVDDDELEELDLDEL